jgi:hypothetical protein
MNRSLTTAKDVLHQYPLVKIETMAAKMFKPVSVSKLIFLQEAQ